MKYIRVKFEATLENIFTEFRISAEVDAFERSTKCKCHISDLVARMGKAL